MSTDKILALNEALAGIFSEPCVNLTKPQPSSPVFDQAALVEIFSEPPLISNSANASPPNLDHRALVEIFGEAPAIPVDSQPPPLSFGPRFSSLAPSALDNEEPAAEPAAVAPLTNSKNALPRRAKSLLAELRSIFSTSVEKDPRPRSPFGRPYNSQLTAKTIAAITPIDAEGARSQLAKSLLEEPSPLISTNSEPPHLSFKQERSSPSHSVQPGDAKPSASELAASPTTVQSLPLASINTTPSLPSLARDAFSVLSGQQDDVAPVKKTYLESAQARQVNMPSTEPSPLSSTNGKPLTSAQLEPSSGAPTDAERAVTQPQEAGSLLIEAPMGATNTIPRPHIFEILSSTISLPNVEPKIETVAPAALNEAEIRQPQRGITLLADLPPSRFFFAREPAAKAAAVAFATDEQSTQRYQAKSLLAKLDLDTAIRLRWLMRDIRGKRTLVPSTSKNDLAALVDMGLVEMREELPNLTALGDLALD